MEHTRAVLWLPAMAEAVGMKDAEVWSGTRSSAVAAQAACYWWGMCETQRVHTCSGADIHMGYDGLAALWLLLKELTYLLIVRWQSKSTAKSKIEASRFGDFSMLE